MTLGCRKNQVPVNLTLSEGLWGAEDNGEECEFFHIRNLNSGMSKKNFCQATKIKLVVKVGHITSDWKLCSWSSSEEETNGLLPGSWAFNQIITNEQWGSFQKGGLWAAAIGHRLKAEGWETEESTGSGQDGDVAQADRHPCPCRDCSGAPS